MACLATPLLIFGAAGITELGKLYGPTDAAGSSRADARGLTETEVSQLHQQRWQELQEKLVPLRERIAEDGWSPAGSRTPSSNPALADDYRLDVAWHVAVPIDDPSATTEALYDHLAASGWIVDGEIPPPRSVTARSGLGGEVRVSVTASVEDPTIVTITISAESPSYWAEDPVVTWQPINSGGPSTETFRFDEWPPLIPAD